MKKKLLLVVSMMALLVCLLAVCVSAENNLNSQTSNEYGTLSTFDESITVGRTDNQNGFSPYIAETGNTYARVVIGDGTTFYTFPTAYIYSSSRIYGKDGKTLWSYDLTSLNSAMEAATGTNPNWTKENVYRIELPYNTAFLNTDGTQKFYGFSNVIEIYLQPNMTSIDTGANCIFHSCKNLEVIHNLDSFVFRAGAIAGSFQNCEKLTSLTIGISPEITDPGENAFNGCKALRSVNIQEAFPNLTKIGKQMFRYCYALENFSSEGQQGAYVMPSTVTRIEEYAFNECKAVKYISVSPNVTYIGPAAFNTCSALEFVDFNGNQNDVDFNNWGTFMNCTNLKAVSMPDNTDYITNRMFSGCTNLMAVYLPSATVNIESNGYGAHTSFYCCYNLYFVNEQFEVRDENGLFYGDSFVQPTRPDVYYFPSKLEKIFDRNEGIGFASCYNLNPTMVFPETLKKFWINDGVFYECGKTGSKFTVVFLADMTDVRIGMRENRAKGVSYIFANAADTDLSCVNVIDTSPNYTPSFAGGEFMAFCASGKYFNLFNLGGSNDASQYTNDNVTYVTDENGSYVAKHLRNPKLDVTTPADCLNAKTVVTKCFCGCVLETVTEGEALGHNEGELIAVIYGDADKFFACGDHHYDCTRCDETVVKEDAAPIIFKVIGYAYTEAVNPSKAVMQAFAVNKVALNAYNDMTEDDIVGYGLVAANANVTEAFDNGVANINAVAQFQNTDYDVMEMKVTGLEGSNDVVGAFSGVKLHCCAYILTLNGENIDSYYATEVLNSEVSGVAIAVTDTLVADNAASYDDIFADRNP